MIPETDSSCPSASAGGGGGGGVCVASSLIDLNLVPPPKLEPKPEPPDVQPFELGPVAPVDPEPLAEETPESGDASADDIVEEYLRLAHRFAAAAAAGGGDYELIPIPNSPPPPPRNASAPGVAPTDVVVSRKRKPRSSEMVRVSSLGARELLYFRDLVRRTRITYESLRALLLLRGDDGPSEARRSRADNKAAILMADRDLWINRDRRIIGSIPGINVGDVFLFRMELCVLGLHGQTQAGIDYVTASRSSTGEPIATSIVLSGGYEDDVDSGPVIIYTGHGGREYNMHRHSVDQKLVGGNLALERSMKYGIEVRVIRGVRCDGSPLKKVYVYDGLYKIVESWLDVGKSGFGVYKYKLLRMEGQEEMGSAILRVAEELKANPFTVRPNGYLSLDMSMARENYPVRLFNDIDDDREPLLFEYLARPIYPARVLGMKKNADDDGECEGCQCISNCPADGCSCTRRNGGEFAYDGHGILLKGKPLIYECGKWCHCPPTCPNRLSQRGVTHRFEIFRSKETGWGVRSLDLIRAGAFVCEFSGIVLTKQQAESGSSDCLVHPGQLPARWVEWGDISDVQPECVSSDFRLADLSFAMDVSRKRNVGCYLSHSCTPNVFAQYVLFDHHNTSYPHVMIFAMETIPPLRELSMDYGIRDELIGRLTM